MTQGEMLKVECTKCGKEEERVFNVWGGYGECNRPGCDGKFVLTIPLELVHHVCWMNSH